MKKAYLILPVLLLPILLKAQTLRLPYRWQVDTLVVAPSASYKYIAPASHLLQKQTLRITKNKHRLTEEIDFRWKDERTIRFFTVQPNDTLRIRYRRLPFDFRQRYTLFSEETVSDSALKDSSGRKRFKAIRFVNPFEHISSGLQTSGSIMRGVQVGTNRDFSLNSGLNVELSGRLTDNVEVVAALTDEATPIQPEGNTQTLNEVDKVFVKFKSPYVQGTVGDFNLEYKNSEFGRLTRKLQGITLQGRYGMQRVSATVATTRGFFNHLSFLGQEGNQGPYRLYGKNGERNIVVLAGTEKVWIDGQKMVRGKSNDYTIEYGNGELRFTTRRLITSSSRIEVDFEYFPVSQNYNRNVYSGTATGRWKAAGLKLRMQVYRETDDPSQTLYGAQSLNTEERAVLQTAGDDPLSAFLPGETLKDDLSGSYMKRDTLWQGENRSFFDYTGSRKGRYSVVFSDVGANRGEYNRDRLGVYRWVGPGHGRYLPIRLIPLPSRQDQANLQVEWQAGAHSGLELEYALSRYDQNILSALNDSDNQGSALQAKAHADKLMLHWGKWNLGRVDMNASARYVESDFKALDRFQQPDFQRYWNTDPTDATGSGEQSYQANLTYIPFKQMRMTANAGRLERSAFASNRFSLQAAFRSAKSSVNAGYEEVNSERNKPDSRNIWKRFKAQASYRFWKLDPQFSFKSENRANRAEGRVSGFAFRDFGARLKLYRWKYAEGFYEWNRREDAVYDYKRLNKLIPQATTATQKIALKLTDVSGTSANMQLVHRNKDFTAAFDNVAQDTLKLYYTDPTVQDTVWRDRSTDLAELNMAHSAWKKALNLSLQYRISSEQAALKEKVYLEVGQGRGNLRFDEDLQEYVPDPDGRYMLFVLPSGKYEPVTTVQSALRLKIDPARYWRKSAGWWSAWLRQVSSESYFRVEEESKDPDVWSVYLLNLSHFQGDYTVRGVTQFNQDWYIMRRNRALSFRLRYRLRKNRSNQFVSSGENEDGRSEESGLRANWRVSGRLKAQTEFRLKHLVRQSAANPLRNRDIGGWYAQQNFSYRPFKRWELGLESEYGKEENRSLTYPITLWYALVKTRFTYALPASGRVTAQYQYQTVKPTDNPENRTVPYEMARGKKEGVSQNWQARLEYTLAKNVVFSLFYNGRDEAGFKRVIHSGQAEIRAFF